MPGRALPGRGLQSAFERSVVDLGAAMQPVAVGRVADVAVVLWWCGRAAAPQIDRRAGRPQQRQAIAGGAEHARAERVRDPSLRTGVEPVEGQAGSGGIGARRRSDGHGADTSTSRMFTRRRFQARQVRPMLPIETM